MTPKRNLKQFLPLTPPPPPFEGVSLRPIELLDRLLFEFLYQEWVSRCRMHFLVCWDRSFVPSCWGHPFRDPATFGWHHLCFSFTLSLMAFFFFFSAFPMALRYNAGACLDSGHPTFLSFWLDAFIVSLILWVCVPNKPFVRERTFLYFSADFFSSIAL